MTLTDLGYKGDFDDYLRDGLSVGRVTQEHRERYIVSTGENEFDSEITGNLRFTATSREDFPAVGDWVLINIYDDDLAIIHKVLPRKSLLQRQSVSKFGEKQIISANIDTALIVQSIDRNFSINRLERYLTICYSDNIEPVLVISKIDLPTANEIESIIFELGTRDKNIKTILLSNISMVGFDQLLEVFEKGRTYCVVGSSGVGKSTIINNLLQKEVLPMGEISWSTGKGRHITSHRELFVLGNGGIIIDTPGMRELGIIENEEGLKSTFEDIFTLGRECRFPNCSHTRETGCAVLEAIKIGTIDSATLDNFQRMQRDQQRFLTSVAEKRRKDKVTGRLYKSIMKEKKKNKF